MHSLGDLATILDSPFASRMDRLAHGAPNAGHRRDTSDEFASVLARHGGVHARDVLERFEARGLEIVDVGAALDAALGLEGSTDRHLTGLWLTREALRRDVDVVFRGVLALDDFAGGPDCLLRCEGASLLGEHRYEVCDAMLARTVAPRHLLQLCFRAEMLHAAQGRHARDVVIVTGGARGAPTASAPR